MSDRAAPRLLVRVITRSTTAEDRHQRGKAERREIVQQPSDRNVHDLTLGKTGDFGAPQVRRTIRFLGAEFAAIDVQSAAGP